MPDKYKWNQIETRLKSAGVDTSRTFDFSGATVHDGACGAYQLPFNGGPHSDLAPGTYSINGNLYRVTDHEGNVMIGNAGGSYSEIRNELENIGFKEGGSVPFTAGQLTGPTDAKKLAAVRGVEEKYALALRFEGSAFHRPKLGKWMGNVLKEAEELAKTGHVARL